MKRLPNDVSRCLGRSDLTAEATICPDRETCARYRTIAIDREAHPDSGYPHSIVTTMRGADGECRHRMEVQP